MGKPEFNQNGQYPTKIQKTGHDHFNQNPGLFTDDAHLYSMQRTQSLPSSSQKTEDKEDQSNLNLENFLNLKGDNQPVNSMNTMMPNQFNTGKPKSQEEQAASTHLILSQIA